MAYLFDETMEVESPIDDKRWITNEGELTDEEYAEYVRQVSDSEVLSSVNILKSLIIINSS